MVPCRSLPAFLLLARALCFCDLTRDVIPRALRGSGTVSTTLAPSWRGLACDAGSRARRYPDLSLRSFERTLSSDPLRFVPVPPLPHLMASRRECGLFRTARQEVRPAPAKQTATAAAPFRSHAVFDAEDCVVLSLINGTVTVAIATNASASRAESNPFAAASGELKCTSVMSPSLPLLGAARRTTCTHRVSAPLSLPPQASAPRLALLPMAAARLWSRPQSTTFRYARGGDGGRVRELHGARYCSRCSPR